MDVYSILARMSLAGYKVTPSLVLITPRTERNGKWERFIESKGIKIRENTEDLHEAKENQVRIDALEFKEELRKARIRRLQRAVREASKEKIVYKCLGVPMTEWEDAMMNLYRELFNNLPTIYQRKDF